MTLPAPPASAPIPVICDQCRATGIAGDETFSAIPDILAFDPVPRRAHVNNWTAEHQRAFIAALALTGSPRQAARALGRHMFGAQQLRTARGGKSFDAAWDAALELARDREFAQIQANLTTLSADRAADEAAARAGATGRVPTRTMGRVVPRLDAPDAHFHEARHDTIADDVDPERRDYLDTQIRVRDKLTRARRLYLFLLVDNPAKRAAWETLAGPVDWDRASRRESQADEPFADPGYENYEGHDINPHNLTSPAMLLTAEAGFLASIAGGHDTIAELVAASSRAQESEFEERSSTGSAGR